MPALSRAPGGGSPSKGAVLAGGAIPCLGSLVMLLGLLGACAPPRRAGPSPDRGTAVRATPTDSTVGVASAATPESPPPASSAATVTEPLAARQDAAIAAVRAEVGATAAVEVISDYYILIGPKAAVAQSTDFVRRVLEAYFHGRFRTGVSRPLPILLFPDASSYQAYCHKTTSAACISRFGYFEPSAYRLVMNLGPGIGTLSHELVHPILHEDFPQAPIWVNEGIASLYEAPVMPRPGEIHGAKNWRLPRLLLALRTPAERDHASLQHVMDSSWAQFRDSKEDLHYAVARYLCKWLDDQGLLWPFYHRFRDNVATDPQGMESFEAVVGESPTSLQPKWERWVRSL